MREPSPLTSRLAITAGIAAALGLAGIGFIAGRNSAPVPEQPFALPAPSPSPRPVPVPVVQAALDRADLLALATQAADAFAQNLAMPAPVTAVAGRRFNLILPFGCEAPGMQGSAGTMRWSFDPKAARLKITVDPVIWQPEEWGAAGDARVLRGFWISRPWSSATICAAARTDFGAAWPPIMPPSEWIAIAREIGPAEGAKARPYEVVQRATASDFDPAQGFQFRITGRIRPTSEGGPVTCAQPGGAAQRPLCVIAATFSEVSIENPKNGDVLANWPIEGDVRGPDDMAGLRQGNATSPDQQR